MACESKLQAELSKIKYSE